MITQSLRSGILPPSLAMRLTRSYQHTLGGSPVTIAEASVPGPTLGKVLLELSDALLPESFYAHVWTKEVLYVCFPGVIARVPKDDQAAARRAQDIGRMFGIPLQQMRFLEMLTVDHPDA